MAETRHHARRLPEIEARDEKYMAMRRSGFSCGDAARHLGMSVGVQQQVERDFRLQYGEDVTPQASDDREHVAAVLEAGGFGRFLETRGRNGEPRLTGPYVPYTVERLAMGARG